MEVKIPDGAYHPTGSCFDDIVDLMIALTVANKGPFTEKTMPFIVHGIQLLDTGKKAAHAWLEYRGRCYDMRIFYDKRTIINYSKKDFYKKLKIIDKTRYTPQACKEMVRLHGDTTGPWEQKYKELTRDYEK